MTEQISYLVNLPQKQRRWEFEGESQFEIQSIIAIDQEYKMKTPEQLAQAQLEAYNQGKIDDFASCYSENVEVRLFPSMELRMKGRESLHRLYGEMFVKYPELNAKLVSRIAHGNKVIDEEYVTGRDNTPMKAIAIYEVKDELIQKVWFVKEE